MVRLGDLVRQNTTKAKNLKRRKVIQKPDLPAELYGFVTHCDGEELDVPQAIIRCCKDNTEDNQEFESQLLDRYAKEYLPSGKPKIDLVPVMDITKDVLVVEDTPFLLEDEDEWEELLHNS